MAGAAVPNRLAAHADFTCRPYIRTGATAVGISIIQRERRHEIDINCTTEVVCGKCSASRSVPRESESTLFLLESEIVSSRRIRTRAVIISRRYHFSGLYACELYARDVFSRPDETLVQ